MADNNYDWRIVQNENPEEFGISDLKKLIVNDSLNTNVPREAYNYDIFTPIVLIPFSNTMTLVLSDNHTSDDIELHIHDLRVVSGLITGSINFLLRGNKAHLSNLRREIPNYCDIHRRVDAEDFFRKLFYSGFTSIYAPKKLKHKDYSPLEDALGKINELMQNKPLTNKKE